MSALRNSNDHNICIASQFPSSNNFDPPFPSPSAWQVTPTIQTFIQIMLSLKSRPSHMKRQTFGQKTSLHGHTIFKLVKRQVSCAPPLPSSLYQLIRTSRHIPLQAASTHLCSLLSFVATIKGGYRTLITSVYRYVNFSSCPGTLIRHDGGKSTLLGFEGFRATSDEIATSNLVERRARSKSNQSRRTRNKRVESPLRSPRQSAVMREVLERPYLCKACGERYAQPQGVNRHYRAKHDPSSCNYCGANWSRPYQYRDHIEKRHPDIDPDLVLGKVAGSRRKATVIGREQPPAIIHGQQIHHISMRPTPTLPAPAAVKATRVPSSLFSNGKEAQPVSVLPPVRQAPDRSSRAATALFPTPLPAGGFYGASSVSFDPIIESSGVILYPSQFSVANYGGVWTNAFKPRV